MNKKRVDRWIPYAKEAIKKLEIADINDNVLPTFRSQISAFGASVVMGSLKASVAFFSERGDAKADRHKLLQAIEYVIRTDAEVRTSGGSGKLPDLQEKTADDILDDVCKHYSIQMEEEFIDAAIAIKLALNLFGLGKSDTGGDSDA